MAYDEREELLRLKEQTEDFIQEVFDWVQELEQPALLGELYNLQGAIERKLNVSDTDEG